MTESAQSKSLSLLDELSKADADLRKVGQIILDFDGLREDVMRSANSVSFSLQHEVVDIFHAVSILGQNRLKQIVQRTQYRVDSAHQPPRGSRISPTRDSKSARDSKSTPRDVS